MLQELIDAYMAVPWPARLLVAALTAFTLYFVVLVPDATRKARAKWQAAGQRLRAKLIGAWNGWRNGPNL
ncbi:hypothetical protein ACFW6V_34625 [Streptomyces sp. NPDC058734]|uniref:hypothetical protein n=1 Tax=Streptomyces sp. NPDC058734 TaxID=3346615 RepID=UPI0036B2E457